MKKYVISFLCLFSLLAFTINDFYNLYIPEYFPKPVYDFKKEPLTKERVELGRALFYDPVLSKDGTVSCASCHTSYNAFAHIDHALSHGIGDSIGRRNAPALFNLAWQKQFMWDGAVNHIEVQALAPISDKKEMAESLENVIRKLQAKKLYRSLFYRAFSDSTITGQHLLKAIAQFQLTLISANSKYDQVKKGKESFTNQEQNGYGIFKRNCNSCHQEPLFSSYKFANNGLPIDSHLKDLGRIGVTQQRKDSLLFKIPSLRNLSYSYPYMHDGRFSRLSQVISHYTNGIQQNSKVSKELKKKIILTDNEKVDLIAFLLTLNDKEFVKNPDFQFPKEILLSSEGK
ncbi:MAG: c-type cytochrome [Chryseobacterium sp.]|nr:MAG: c-type cytochrome [Chryseobacterium sp.]